MLGGILNIKKLMVVVVVRYSFTRETLTRDTTCSKVCFLNVPAANHTQERNYSARNDNAAEDTEQVHNGLLLLKIPNSTKGLGVKTVLYSYLKMVGAEQYKGIILPTETLFRTLALEVTKISAPCSDNTR